MPGFTYLQKGSIRETTGGVTAANEFEADGVILTERRPCMVWFRGDLYIIGYYTRPVVQQRETNGRWYPAGIRRPMYPLAVAPGGGTGGSSGSCLAFITFLHKVGSKVLAESNPSNVVNVGELTGQGRAWTNIDSSTAESRVTHVRGYVSMNGDLFRAAWESPYGITALEENVRTLQLTFAGPNEWQYGIPPETYFGHVFAGRMWYAHSAAYPYRIWYSEPGKPQQVRASSFRDTLDREPITGIWKGRNELIVFCRRSSYMIRDSGTGVFVMEKLDSDVGCITHHGIQEIHNKIWFPSEDGIWIYDGSFRYLMKELTPLWRDDFDANRAAFDNGFALHDRIDKVYMFVTRRVTRPEFENSDISPGTLTYAGYYGAFEPSMVGNQPHPEWTLDMKYRFDSCGFYDEFGRLVIGDCDGKIRVADEDDPDDDGDSLNKALIIRRGHDLFFEPGDDLEQGGKHLAQLWYYVESEYTAWSCNIKGGDEQSWQGIQPDDDFWHWSATVAASAKSETRVVKGSRSGKRYWTQSYVPATVHWFTPERVTGRGFTMELRATAPRRLQYRGVGGMWAPGSTQRGVASYLSYDLTASANGESLPGAVVLTSAGDLTFSVTVPQTPITTWPITITITGTGTGGVATNFVRTIVLSSPIMTGDTTGDPVTMLDGDSWSVTIVSVEEEGQQSEVTSGTVSCVVP